MRFVKRGSNLFQISNATSEADPTEEKRPAKKAEIGPAPPLKRFRKRSKARLENDRVERREKREQDEAQRKAEELALFEF